MSKVGQNAIVKINSEGLIEFYSCGDKFVVFLVSRFLTQNTTDFWPQLYIVQMTFKEKEGD